MPFSANGTIAFPRPDRQPFIPRPRTIELEIAFGASHQMHDGRSASNEREVDSHARAAFRAIRIPCPRRGGNGLDLILRLRTIPHTELGTAMTALGRVDPVRVGADRTIPVVRTRAIVGTTIDFMAPGMFPAIARTVGAPAMGKTEFRTALSARARRRIVHRAAYRTPSMRADGAGRRSFVPLPRGFRGGGFRIHGFPREIRFRRVPGAAFGASGKIGTMEMDPFAR